MPYSATASAAIRQARPIIAHGPPAGAGEAVEHRGDADELAAVDEPVVAGPRQARGQREHERTGRDPGVGPHASSARDRVQRAAETRCFA
jgi:hypothetical protein